VTTYQQEFFLARLVYVSVQYNTIQLAECQRQSLGYVSGMP